MNQSNGKRTKKGDGTLLTTFVVVGGAIVAGTAVFYGVAGLMKADIPELPTEPFTLEVPSDFKEFTAPSSNNPQGIPDTVQEPVVVAPPQKTEKAPENTPEKPKNSETAPASSTQTNIVDETVDTLYVKPVDGKIQKTFSMGELVYSETLGDYRVHNGIDLSAPVGAKVRAMANGAVTAIYFDPRLGSVVEITHSNKTISRYCNLLPDLAGGIIVGAKVKMGDTIAGVGESALSESTEGTHIHLEVIKNGKHLNPETLFK